MFRHFSIPALTKASGRKLTPSIASRLKSHVPPGAMLLSKLNPEIELSGSLMLKHGSSGLLDRVSRASPSFTLRTGLAY